MTNLEISTNDVIPATTLQKKIPRQLVTEMPTISDIPITHKTPPLLAIGIRPIAPTLFYDIDTKYLDQPEMNIVNKEMRWRWTLADNPELAEISKMEFQFEKLERFIKMKERHLWYSKLNHQH